MKKREIEMTPGRKKTLDPDLQTITETQERIIISADCGRHSKLLKKEEAIKPLYLKRV